MIKFIGRVFGINRYNVFLAIDNDCWRKVKNCSFISFKNACRFADRMKRLELSEDVTYVVAVNREDEPLYSA
jgi:hypothetical protein